MRSVYFVHDVNMKLSHESLVGLAAESGVDVGKLPRGTFVFFLNGAQTAFKLMPNPHMLFYYRHPQGRIQFDALKSLPNFFKSESMDAGYTEALTDTLRRQCRQLLEARV